MNAIPSLHLVPQAYLKNHVLEVKTLPWMEAVATLSLSVSTAGGKIYPGAWWDESYMRFLSARKWPV